MKFLVVILRAPALQRPDTFSGWIFFSSRATSIRSISLNREENHDQSFADFSCFPAIVRWQRRFFPRQRIRGISRNALAKSPRGNARLSWLGTRGRVIFWIRLLVFFFPKSEQTRLHQRKISASRRARQGLSRCGVLPHVSQNRLRGGMRLLSELQLHDFFGRVTRREKWPVCCLLQFC